jgi:hypothetical protein
LGAQAVRAIAVLTSVMGLVNVLSAATPSLASRLALIKRYAPSRCGTAGASRRRWRASV